MDDFGAFCYMDVQKTGSTFITKTLKEVSLLPVLASEKHSTVEDKKPSSVFKLLRDKVMGQRMEKGIYRPGCFYFNSVRDPFDYYASLYNYGCDGRGGMAGRIREAGLGSVYDGSEEGFLNWIEFVLDSDNAKHCDRLYGDTCGNAVGFFTFRFLRLSFANPTEKLKAIVTPEDVLPVYEAHNICDFTVRNEHLNHDLKTLFETHLRQFVKSSAVQYLEGAKKINKSVSRAATGDVLRNSQYGAAVRARDALVFEKFYPS